MNLVTPPVRACSLRILTGAIALASAAWGIDAQGVLDPSLILPKVHSEQFPLDRQGGGIEIPAARRLEMPDGQGTLEFWVRPEWESNQRPRYHCVLANGRPVYQRIAPDADEFELRFEARYAVYLTDNSIVFQSGSVLHETYLTQFPGAQPFSPGIARHVAIATNAGRTTIYLDGQYSLQLDAGYGDTAGHMTVVGGLPVAAAGVVFAQQGSRKKPIEITSDQFGPMKGLLGGVRLWDRDLGVRALTPSSVAPSGSPAPILFYGQFHAERDFAVDSIGDTGARRADLVAYSDFSPPRAPRMIIADPIAGSWVDNEYPRPRVIAAEGAIAELEPITLLDPYFLVTVVAGWEQGGDESRYKLFVNGDWAGDLRQDGEAEQSLRFVDLDHVEYEVDIQDGGDKLVIKGEPDLFAAPNRGRQEIELIRDPKHEKGAPARSDDAWIAGIRQTNIAFLLRSYNLLKLDPLNYFGGAASKIGSAQYVFEVPGAEEWQLAFDGNTLIPMSMYSTDYGESDGGESSLTVTTEEEMFTAYRAKFGVSGGKPGAAEFDPVRVKKGVTVGVDQSSESSMMRSHVSTFGQSWAKMGRLLHDPNDILLTKEFRTDIAALDESRDFSSFVDKWGTHYSAAAAMGALMYWHRDWSESSIRNASSWGVNISAFYETGPNTDPALRVDASGSVEMKKTRKEAFGIEDVAWKAFGVAAISKPDMFSGSPDLQTAVPISMDLRLLSELLSPAYFDDPGIYEGLRYDLRDALLTYLRGVPASIEPVAELPDVAESLILHVRISRFQSRTMDQAGGGGNPCEFYGRIAAMIYSDYYAEPREVLQFGNTSPNAPTELWNNTDKDNRWFDEEFTNDGFQEKSGSEVFSVAWNQNWVEFNPQYGKPSDLAAPWLAFDKDQRALLTIPVDLRATTLEDVAVELQFFLGEDDDFDGDDRYGNVILALKEKDFRTVIGGQPGTFATEEEPRAHLISLFSGDQSVEFEVDAWAETTTDRWFNRDSMVYEALTRTISEHTPKARSRSALNVVEIAETRSVGPEDVLAYFPCNYDGYRRPGARVLAKENWIDNVPMGEFTLQFDYRLGVHDLDLLLDGGEAQGNTQNEGELSFSIRYWHDDSDKDLRWNRAWQREHPGNVIGDVEEDWNAIVTLSIPGPAMRAAYERAKATAEGWPGLPLVDAQLDSGHAVSIVARLDTEEGLSGKWCTIGIAVDLAKSELRWRIIDRETMQTVGSARENLAEPNAGSPAWLGTLLSNLGVVPRKQALRIRIEEWQTVSRSKLTPALDEGGNVTLDEDGNQVMDVVHEDVSYLRKVPIHQTTDFGEMHLLKRALSLSEIESLAEAPRTPAQIMVWPLAYWPFDYKRSSAPRMRSYPAALGYTYDDALMLTPGPETFDVSGLDFRDLTIQFDVRFSDSTRSVVLEDEYGIMKVELRRDNSFQELRVSAGSGPAAIRDFEPVPYSWQRIAVSFDGVVARVVADDGSGWVIEDAFSIDEHSRDRIADVMRKIDGMPQRKRELKGERVDAQRRRDPEEVKRIDEEIATLEDLAVVSWSVRSDYHHPGTLLKAEDGYFPEQISEFTLFDELRIWAGAQDPKMLARGMRTPRLYTPAPSDPALFAYFPMEVGTAASGKPPAKLLDAIVHPEYREGHAQPISAIYRDASVVDGALELEANKPLQLPTPGLPMSDFTMHLDFRPGYGELRIGKGPFSFVCEDGRTSIVLESSPEERALEYDPAFGERIALDDWHKLTLAIDAWRSRLRVFLDGESWGDFVLTGPEVNRLRAADAEGGNWTIQFTPNRGVSTGCLVDELIFMRPGLGPVELERLSTRIREPGGAPAPRRMRLCRDVYSDSLRQDDEAIRESVVAYLPLGSDGGALRSREVRELDLERYTIATWFQLDETPATIFGAPGMTLATGTGLGNIGELLDEAVRKGVLSQEQLRNAAASEEGRLALIRSLLKGGSLQTASLVGLGFISGMVYPLVLRLESADGRVLPVELQWDAAPSGFGIFGNAVLHPQTEAEEMVSTAFQSPEGWEYTDLRGGWHSLVLCLDVEAGEVRGVLDGRRLKRIELPKGFRLKSPLQSVSRDVWSGQGSVSIDELLLLNDAPLESSSVWEYLTMRRRIIDIPVLWESQ